MGGIFFNNSTYDFFKKDKDVGLTQARPPIKKVKVKKTKPPPPMKIAKEKVVKNRDGTITLHKIDKGGFTQTINIYTGRQSARGIKAKGIKSVPKEKSELFTPSGRPDFKKWSLYQSSFQNQLITDRLLRLKDKEDGKLEKPENIQAIVDKASDDMRRDILKLEDRQTHSLDQIQRQQAQNQSLMLDYNHRRIRRGRGRKGHYTTSRRTDSEPSGSEELNIKFFSQREKDLHRAQLQREEEKIQEIDEPLEEVSEDEIERLSRRGVERILTRISQGKLNRSHLKGLRARIGEELTEEQFSQIEDAFESYIGSLREEQESRERELQEADILTDDLRSTATESEGEYLREGSRPLGDERKKFLKAQKIPKRKFYSENWGEQTLYETQPAPDYHSYFGNPDTLTDLEVTAVKLGVDPLTADGTPKGLKELSSEMVDKGTARQVKRWEDKMDEEDDRYRAAQSSRQARPQGIPASQRELRKVGGDVALHRTKQGVVTAVKDYRRAGAGAGGKFKSVDQEVQAHRQKLTNKNQVIDRHFGGDEMNLLAGKAEIRRLLNDGKITPKAFKEVEKLRRSLKPIEAERRREKRESLVEAVDKARTKTADIDSGGEQAEVEELLLSPREPEPETEPQKFFKAQIKTTGAQELAKTEAEDPYGEGEEAVGFGATQPRKRRGAVEMVSPALAIPQRQGVQSPRAPLEQELEEPQLPKPSPTGEGWFGTTKKEGTDL